MSKLQINTTQNVNLDYKIVGVGERIAAFLIDGFILYLFAVLVQLIGQAIGYVFDDSWTQIGWVGLIFLPAMFYSLILHSLFNGQTVGKMLLKIRVVRLEEVGETYAPKFTNVTILTDRDVRLIKETYQIAKKSRDQRTMKALRDKVESLLYSDSDLYDLPYLDTVLKDYNFYTQKS